MPQQWTFYRHIEIVEMILVGLEDRSHIIASSEVYRALVSVGDRNQSFAIFGGYGE